MIDLLLFFGLLIASASIQGLIRVFSSPDIFGSSIFRKLPAKYFLRSESWSNGYRKYLTGELIVSRFNRLNRPEYSSKFGRFFHPLFDAVGVLSVLRDGLFLFAILNRSGVSSPWVWVLVGLAGINLGGYWFARILRVR